MHGDDKLLSVFLLDAGLMSRGQLADALERAQGGPLAGALAEMGILPADDLRRAQAHALGVPFVTLTRHDIAQEAMVLIPEPLARAHNVLAYRLADAGVEVAVLDLGSLAHLGELKRTHRILPRLTSSASMREALLHYQKHLKEKFGQLLEQGAHVGEALIGHALYSRAGGVHIDPHAMGTLVRYQVGHALHEAFVLPEQLGKQMVSQLKALARLLPVERVQEGRFKVDRDGRAVHVRVHALPHKGGERLHLRLAQEGARGYMLESLGFHGEALHRVERALSHGEGLLVAEGPRGAGKTTLLATLEDLLHAPHRTIVHAQDAAAARAALRHDPHVLVLDDVSDEALAALGRAAAERGVLVLAAAEPGVFAQEGVRVRVAVVRALCTKSFTDMRALARAELARLEPHADFVRLLAALKDEGVVDKHAVWKDVRFARATACSECRDGYEGRVGIQEVSDRAGLAGLSLIEDGLFKAAQGRTSVEEVLRLNLEEPGSKV